MPNLFVCGSNFTCAQEQRNAGWKKLLNFPALVLWGYNNLLLFMNSLSLKVEVSSLTAPLGTLSMTLPALIFKIFLLMSTPHFSRTHSRINIQGMFIVICSYAKIIFRIKDILPLPGVLSLMCLQWASKSSLSLVLLKLQKAASRALLVQHSPLPSSPHPHSQSPILSLSAQILSSATIPSTRSLDLASSPVNSARHYYRYSKLL